jgi:uncharacterized damage-inducible protein DinB
VTTSTEDNLGEAQARRLESVDEQLTALLRQPAVERRLRTAEGETDWSAMQVLGHMVEMIPYWMDRCRFLIGAAEPPTFGRAVDAPERLAGVERGASGNLDELLPMLHEQVQAATRAIRQMSMAERGRKGYHVRWGEMTVADMVEVFIVGHAEEHLAQIRAIVQG